MWREWGKPGAEATARARLGEDPGYGKLEERGWNFECVTKVLHEWEGEDTSAIQKRGGRRGGSTSGRPRGGVGAA